MYIDENLEVSAAAGTDTPQVLTTTAVSTSSIDLGSIRDVGEGRPLYFVTIVTTDFAGGTNMSVKSIISAAAALTGPRVVGDSVNYITALLKAEVSTGIREGAGPIITPVGPLVWETGLQFLGVQYAITGTMSGGSAVRTHLVIDYDDAAKFYPSGFVV